MATPIGRILLMPKGDWNNVTTYNSLDWVRDSGASWVCKVDNTVGIAPPTLPTTSNANWQLLSSDGTVGGWSSILYKPFETLGDALYENPSKELSIAVDSTLLIGTRLGVDVQNTYSSSSTKPISGQGVDDAISGKADKTEIIHWIDATLPSGQSSYNVTNTLFKTTSRVVQILANGGGTYSSVSITTDGTCTITFPSALTSSLSISIGISNALSA